MSSKSDTGLLVVAGGILLLLAGTAFASFGPSSTGNANIWGDPLPDGVTPDVAPIDSFTDTIMPSTATLDQKIAAFLATIRQFESHNDYRVIYGGGYFSDYLQHPRPWVLITMGQYAGQHSSAAGAYQINWPTYEQFAPGLGITDFSPDSQDRIAAAILQSTGAVDFLDADDIQGALHAASGRWASLPYSTAGQHPQSLQIALDTYSSNLG